MMGSDQNRGNRFGGGVRNFGGDSLANLVLRHALLSRLRGDRQAPSSSGQVAQPGVGFTIRPTEMTTGGPSSAAGSAAFNERTRDRALYGSHGRGGIEREKITAQALSDVAKRMMTPRDRADIALKKQEHDLREAGKWNWKDEFEDGGRETAGPRLGGERIGGAPVRTPVAPAPITARAPSLREIVPVPEHLNVMNMPGGAGMITRRNPDGSTEYLTTGLPDGERAAAPAPRTTLMEPTLQDVVRSIMAEEAQKPAVAVKAPAAKGEKVLRLRDVARKQQAGNQAVRDVDIWGTGQGAPRGRSIWDDLKDYLGYAKRRAY